MTEPRRPLVQHGGPIHSFGPSEARALLERALELAASSPADTLTHGFHTWTARMHPAIAHVLVDALAPRGSAVLDPFSGSGTVALEAYVQGRFGVGADLNPLAPLVGQVKCQRRDSAERGRLDAALREVAARSEERVRAREPAHAPVPPEIARWFEGHVLKELAGLREELLAVEDERDRDAMRVVFSSILVKMSKKRGDSASGEAEKTLRKGLATELFLRKGLELVDRYAELFAAIPRDAEPPRFLQADVRELGQRLPRGLFFELVMSSPPYGGTYDYVDHHALRYAFLGLDAAPMTRHEIGARRNATYEGALERWNHETVSYLRAIRERLAHEGHVLLVVGDGRVERRSVPAIEHLGELAPHADLELHAAASEPRVDPLGGPPRAEHVVWLRARPSRARTPDAPVRPSRSDARPSRGSGAAGSDATRRPGPSRSGRNRPRSRG